ncbi:hypothetical protein BP422_15750 [Brevibacillus formosus]|uniref:HTH cro/C1-type domain-containing protein n=1 Tax=Brevibacillus formosus TaxID=54913 RepID=A0A220MJ59_9BACL|nr:helix-turn-helix transcriptional regulator [Brevibacillus formosus]ASJ54892.1 hypothetical protein BP422_15750 [Brevibacillus formosus]
MSDSIEELNRKEFGAVLKMLREKARINDARVSQEKLAELLDVSRITIVNTEKGQNVPKASFVEKAFHLFQSGELVIRYVLIQQDKKEVSQLAMKIQQHDYKLAIRVIQMIMRESLNQGDLHGVITNLFRLVLWDIEEKGKTSRRKIQYLIQAFKNFDPEHNGFLDLLDELYHISKKRKNFDAFLSITEAITQEIKLDDRRLSQLLYQEATALYIKGQHDKAYRLSNRALEAMGGVVYQHTAHVYHRHSLICMQLAFYEEALEHAKACLDMAPKASELHKLVKQGMARMYYMNQNFDEAKELWDELFKTMSKNDIRKVHSLNDIIFMEIRLGHFDKVDKLIDECDRLLQLAEKEEWSFFQAEKLLLYRNKVMYHAQKTGDFFRKDVSDMLGELKVSYLKDEFELTKNFVLEKAFLSAKM